MNIHTLANFLRSRGVLMILHVAIMLLSAWLIYIISVDTFENVSFYEEPKFQKQQFWICVVFMADFFIEFFLSHDKRHYLATHFIFFIVSIPYQAILYHFGWDISKDAADPGRICDGNRSQLVYLQQGYRSFLYLSHHVVLNRIFCESDLLSFRIQGQSGCEMLSGCVMVGGDGCHHRRIKYRSCDRGWQSVVGIASSIGHDDVSDLHSLRHQPYY